MSNIAIIPARGGSKRIPRKNIKDFLGKPIIAYSIETAINCNLFDEVIVSTEDEEIAQISMSYGAEVPFYRIETADDHSTLADVVEEVKAVLISMNKIYDNICLLLPTAPLVTSEDLFKGIEMLISYDADSIRPIVKYSYPIQRAVYLNNGVLKFVNPEYYSARSQDLVPTYHDAGLFYWMKWASGLRGDKRMGFEISEFKAQDIDTESDWDLCEMKYKLAAYEKNSI